MAFREQGLGFGVVVPSYGFQGQGVGSTSFAASYGFTRACFGSEVRGWVLGWRFWVWVLVLGFEV